LLLRRFPLVATPALDSYIPLKQSLWCASVACSIHPHHMPTVQNGHAEVGKTCIFKLIWWF